MGMPIWFSGLSARYDAKWFTPYEERPILERRWVYDFELFWVVFLNRIIIMKQIVIEFLNSLYDLKNFLRYSFKVEKLENKDHYVAFLTKQYHTVEKGFALPEPRLGFGNDKIIDLLNLTPIYIKYTERISSLKILCQF